MEKISGFSKLAKQEKVSWLSSQLSTEVNLLEEVQKYWHQDENLQKLFDKFSENTISNFYLPYGIAPNFVINGKTYAIPMAIEESSVVAAASKAAKIWMTRGGVKARILGTVKLGQVHFFWAGEADRLYNFFQMARPKLLHSITPLVANMERRGGGVLDIHLVDKTDLIENYYQLEVKFETCDAMGANFINSVLESLGKELQYLVSTFHSFHESERKLDVNMCILSNYTPECLVNVAFECPINDLEGICPEMSAKEFALRFERAVQISKVDVHRAVTHNKGIFNGIDAVVLATGNDFRAIEACGHAYAARDGHYRGLSDCSLRNNQFRFELTVPLALGTVGGLTALHPMAKVTMELLGRPDAKELMQIVAAVGLAQNFGALSSLVTTGIQRGHMKMHLLNILGQMKATDKQFEEAKIYFNDKTVSYASVRQFLSGSELRS